MYKGHLLAGKRGDMSEQIDTQKSEESASRVERVVSRRVGAVQSCKEGHMKLFGYGDYIGDFLPVEAVGWMAEAARKAGVTNPKIMLDNGKVIYGCECWWGNEDRVKEMVAAAEKVTDIDIEVVRKEYSGG